MSTAARKARKRSGHAFTKAQKHPTCVYSRAPGLGFTSMAEILAGIVVRGWR